MCSNYKIVTRADHLLTFFGVETNHDFSGPDVFPLGVAPFIRLHDDGSGNRVLEAGQFGMLPQFAKELVFGRKTYNARSETVDQKPSFRDSWQAGRRCIIPAECVYEPCYETGRAVRWAIQKASGTPMGIAGIYRQWKAPDGTYLWTFAMLTVNADNHPVYSRMQKPGDEKRMVVILNESDYDLWLTCSPGQAKSFFKQWQGELAAFPVPLVRSSRSA